jgi:hypothetical protein
LEYWLNYHGFNKLVIKSKIHANIYFVKNAKTQNGYINKTNNDFCIFERLGHAQHNTKRKNISLYTITIFIFIYFFVFLQGHIWHKKNQIFLK